MPALTIAQVLAVPATGGYFADDQAAIGAGAPRDGLAYPGPPVTPGFDAIRAPAEAVSVLLVLSDGHVAHGDCVSVQYSGRRRARAAAARRRARGAARARRRARCCAARAVTAFRPAAALVDRLAAEARSAPPRRTASRRPCSTPRRTAPAGTMADVVRDEWEAGRAAAPRARCSPRPARTAAPASTR